MKDLKHRAIRGGFARVCAQAATFVLRIGSLMVLARLLEPRDFGLVGMVTVVTGVLSLFRSFGLSTAAVQRADVTEEQSSTLFWINIAVGGMLGVFLLLMAPLLASFYHEPRLFWVSYVLASGFLFNGAGVQHLALLQRRMHFTTLARIDIVSLVASIAVGIGMSVGGYGYWALVGMTVTLPLVSTIYAWKAAAWIPGMPHRGVGIRSMMRFGGVVTANGLVVYIAYNLEKVLLGRFWGAEAVGIYGRSYQLVSIPTENLNSAVGDVAFSTLSRLQNDPPRFKSYFLKGYSLVLALTIPATVACALFANEMIFVVLGPKWQDAAAIFRLLAPTILVLALINPLGWLLYALGMVGRSLKVALVLAPLVIAGYVLGLPYGPKGVALGYSTVMALWMVPHIAWCVRGTGISLRDIGTAVSRPVISCAVAAAVASGVQFGYGQSLSPLSRLLLGVTVLLGAYLAMLLYAMGQKTFYVNLLQGLRNRSTFEDKTLVPV
jgi:PST family polysaccharide transporter